MSALQQVLGEMPPDELAATTIVLPTKRLETWLLALLTEMRPALIPPRLLNFEQWLSAESAAANPALGDLEWEVLLAGLIDAGDFHHLRLGHEHELKQLFGELIDADLIGTGERPLGLERLAEVCQEQFGHHAAAHQALSERLTELTAVFREQETILGQQNLQTRKARSAQRSASFAAKLQEDRPLGPTILVGFSSLAPCHEALIRALLGRPQTALWLNQPMPDRDSPLARLKAMISDFGIQAVPSSTVDELGGQVDASPSLVFACDTIATEVEHALDRVEAWLAAGVPPSWCAILVPAEADYLPTLRLALKERSWERNLALAMPLARSQIGSWLRLLTDSLSQPTDRVTLLGLLRHPLTLQFLACHAATAGHDQTDRLAPEHIAAQLGQVLAAGGGPDLPGLARKWPATDPLKPGLTALVQTLAPLWPRQEVDAIAADLTEHDDRQSLAYWRKALQDLAVAFGLLAPSTDSTNAAHDQIVHLASDFDQADHGLSRSSREALAEYLAALGRVEPLADLRLSPGSFWTMMRDKLLQLPVQTVGDPLHGVQILGIAEARYVPVTHACILGCTEGRFPKSLPRDLLLDNWLKQAIGLPGWQLLEAIEDTTFHLLHARIPHLELCYPQQQGGAAPNVRSRFIEALLLNDAAQEHQVSSPSPSSQASGDPLPCDQAGQTLPATETNTQPRTMSASALEVFLRCPYAYALRRERIDPLSLPRHNDAREEGDWLHRVLCAFFTSRDGVVTSELCPPLLDEVPYEQLATAGLDRLEHLTEQLIPDHADVPSLRLQLRHQAWPRFLSHLGLIYDASTWNDAVRGWREFSFGQVDSRPTALIDGHSVALRGAIDSIDRTGDLRLVTDYKRRGHPDRKRVASGLAPQLPFYALALSQAAPQLDVSQMVLGYWSILKGEWHGVAAGEAVMEAARQQQLVPPKSQTTTSEIIAALHALWAWRSSDQPEAPLAPDSSDCQYCQLAGICRRDDPRFAEQFAEQQHLAEQLELGSLSADEGRTP